MASREPSLSQDVVFDILSSPRRRYVLYYLRQVDEPVELTSLAEQVAAWENETEPEQLTDQERKRVYVSLYQTHVPKLNESGIVEYDQDTGLVELSNQATEVDEYLVQPTRRIPWQRFYMALAAISAVLLALTTFDVSIFADVSETAMALIVVVGFLISASAHYLYWASSRPEVPPELQRRR